MITRGWTRSPARLLFVLILAVGAALRWLVHDVLVWSRADETVYLLYARTTAEEGYRAAIAMFVNDPGMWVMPNPLRWGWVLTTSAWCSLTGSFEHRSLATVSTMAGIAVLALTFAIARSSCRMRVALLAVALVATSPLQLALGRRALADEFFSALLLAAVLSVIHATRSDSRTRGWWMGGWVVAMVLAIATKETALLIYPVLVLFWWLRSRRAGAIELTLWALPPLLHWGVFSLLAGDATTYVRIVRIVAESADAPYAAQFQSGPPHRVLIDFLAVAPVATMLTIAAVVAMVMRIWRPSRALVQLAVLAGGALLVHMLLPSQNVRYVAALDPLLRIVAAAFVGSIPMRRAWAATALPAAVVVHAALELALFRKIFLTGGVYDPVTDNLLRALEMLPR